MLDYNRPCTVTGYDDSRVSKPYSIVSAAVAYDDPETGEAHILVINQAISMPHIAHNLLCPMQMRLNDVEVNDKPKFLERTPTDKSHAIVVKNGYGDEVVIPLKLKGVTSYFETRKPTKWEYQQAEANGELIHLTNADLPWDPHCDEYSSQEDALLDHNGKLKEIMTRPPMTVAQLEASMRLN